MKCGLIGAGAFGRHLTRLIPALRRAEVIRFDDVLASEMARANPETDTGAGTEAGANQDGTVLPFDAWRERRFADLDFYVALGYHHLPFKKRLIGEMLAADRRLPAFVDPSAAIDPGCRVGPGCLVLPRCVLDQSVELHAGVVLHNSVTVSHECQIGSACYLAPGVVLSGQVTVGAATFVGTGALVSNHRRIGAEVRIGIGTVVTRDVPDAASAIGNPMRLLEKRLNLE